MANQLTTCAVCEREHEGARYTALRTDGRRVCWSCAGPTTAAQAQALIEAEVGEPVEGMGPQGPFGRRPEPQHLAALIWALDNYRGRMGITEPVTLPAHISDGDCLQLVQTVKGWDSGRPRPSTEGGRQ